MVSLPAYDLLLHASRSAEEMEFALSPPEILQQMHELKALTAQKNVPKLTLRREVLELEKKLHSLLVFEDRFRQKKNLETMKVTALREQLARMRKRLAACEDKDLHKKMDKVTHLLGESLVRQEVTEDISRTEAEKPTEGEPEVVRRKQLQMLEEHLHTVQRRLTFLEEKEVPAEQLERVKQTFALIEGKVQALHRQLGEEATTKKAKHTLLFGPWREKEAEKTESS